MAPLAEECAAALERIYASINLRVAEFKALCRHGYPLNTRSAGQYKRWLSRRDDAK